MKTKKTYIKNYNFWLFLIPFFIAFFASAAFAASTGTTPILQQNGAGCVLQDGDYVTESGWVHRYYIEVPSGLTRLRVQLFDRDIAGNHDFQAGTWNTSCVYTLFNPTGAQVATYTAPNGSTSGDNAWRDLHNTTSTPIPNGHWRLEVNMTGTGGDETNAYGIRADDGTATSAGTELNIYANSFVPLGRMSSTLYPWVTSGCIVDYNDFDGDSTNTISYASRTGAISGSYSGSANNVWLNYPISLTNDLFSTESGLWSATNALSGSNINNFYAGNSSASNPPPTSQPESNTFRIYFQRDDGGKPSKPIVTQKISFVSGPNPPSNGSTTRVRVELVVSNPAAQAITFSGSNLVTANIPGSGVVYAGNTVLSQGSVVSQPSIGGTGNINWNPGAVAAGGTATCYYQVDVTPAFAGQRLPVTGIPGTNGTTASYVDETGNSTYTYGPLCGLAVTEDGDPIPTWVAVSCFEACESEGQPTVEWHTASEIGTIGFNLWRQDKETKGFELVNPNLLPSLPSSPQGGVYRLADPGAQYGEPVVYRLEEVDSLGRTMSYGPFTVTFGAASWGQGTENLPEKQGKEEPTDIYGYKRFNRERSLVESDRLKARRLDRQKGAALAATQARERARITVKGRGLFYVSSAQIAGSLGISVAQAEPLIGQYKLNLTSMGKNIAWLADGNGAGIFFFNKGLETVFSDRNVYWLERGSGLAMESLGGGNTGSAPAGSTYKENLHFEGNHYAFLAASSNPLGDIWFWDYIEAGGLSKSFAMDVPGVSDSGTATLTVTLKGATDTAADNDHHAVVSLNGSEIGGSWWDGMKDHAFQISFSQALLNDGANTLTVSGALDMGAPYSIFYVGSFDLSYQREYKAVNNTLLCRGDGNRVITVTGFTEPQVVVLDLFGPDRPRQVVGVVPDVSGRVSFVPRSGATDYLLSGLNAALRPISVVGDRPAQLKGRGIAGEYLVIAPEELRDAAQELADYRKAKGLKAVVVTLEDIYDAFNYGMPSPLAVREFLAYAYANWGGGKLKYAVLIGKGTYDYKDHLGYGDNLFPVILAKTPQGLCAADKIFGDVAGKNGLPEIAIGRLPAVTNAELQVMIGKIKAYESGQGPWTGQALLIADNADDGGDFAQGCDELASLALGFQAEKIYLNGSTAETRARIMAAWNAGAALVNYCGHAGLDQLAVENIFDVADARSLQNNGQLPLAVLLTCVAGRFELPGYVCLGEALLLNQNGGMAGGLAPSGAGMHADSMRLGEEFYRAALRGQGMTAGQALLAAMKSYLQLGGPAYLLNVYNWLGDPALKFK